MLSHMCGSINNAKFICNIQWNEDNKICEERGISSVNTRIIVLYIFHYLLGIKLFTSRYFAKLHSSDWWNYLRQQQITENNINKETNIFECSECFECEYFSGNEPLYLVHAAFKCFVYELNALLNCNGCSHMRNEYMQREKKPKHAPNEWTHTNQ